MDNPWSFVLDNSSEAIENVSATLNATATPVKTTSKQTVSTLVVATVGLVVGSVGCSANTVVLTVLLRARRQFGSSVHTLIANQSAMDLFACFFAMASLVTMITHRYVYDGNPVVDGLICVVFEGGALTAVGMTAGVMGLMVITLERYFKIVHAVARLGYRLSGRGSSRVFMHRLWVFT